MNRSEMLTLKEAAEIISERFGIEYPPQNIRSNIRYNLVPEAQKSGRDWYVPQEWAETFVPKRKRRSK